MQIKPLQPVPVQLKCGNLEASCFLVELTDTEMQLTSRDYIDKDKEVIFRARFFSGKAVISQIHFSQAHFTYTLIIKFINFQPGLVVNQQL